MDLFCCQVSSEVSLFVIVHSCANNCEILSSSLVPTVQIDYLVFVSNVLSLMINRGTLRQLKPYFKNVDTVIERILGGKNPSWWGMSSSCSTLITERSNNAYAHTMNLLLFSNQATNLPSTPLTSCSWLCVSFWWRCSWKPTRSPSAWLLWIRRNLLRRANNQLILWNAYSDIVYTVPFMKFFVGIE